MFGNKYFEDLDVGDKAVSLARTITEADIVNFAGLSGDYNSVHIDEISARQTPFGRRIAHGLLVSSVASGLFTNCDMNLSMKRNILALVEMKCRFLKPVFIGDTIHVEAEIKEKKETRKIDRGVLLMDRIVCNQNNEAVQEVGVVLMVRRRTSD